MEKKSSTPGLIIWGEKNWLLGTLTASGASGATSMCCGAPVLLLQVRKEVRLLIIYIHTIFCNTTRFTRFNTPHKRPPAHCLSNTRTRLGAGGAV